MNPRSVVFFSGIFLSAALLFQIQPLMAKLLLPQFGGGAGVWTISIVFFQALLLLGYGYANFIRRYPVTIQVTAHAILFISAILVLPEWSIWSGVAPETAPEAKLLLTLAFSIGLPYFALSANGPLLQSWLSKTPTSFSIYRMYALSNAGSFIGLFSYPFLAEPLLGLSRQLELWSWGFVTLSLLIAGAGWITVRNRPSASAEETQAFSPKHSILPWIFLSALTSWLLVSVTTAVTQDIASFPLLWVLPLGIYLFTFILVFESEGLYDRAIFGSALAAALPFFCLLLFADTLIPYYGRIAGYLAIFFLLSLVAHGELARRKPDAGHLTFFYLMIALGGVAGGSAAAFGAPYLFEDYFELPAGVIAAILVFAWFLLTDPASPFHWRHKRKRAELVIWGSVTILLILGYIAKSLLIPIDTARNFYGALRVTERNAGTELASYNLISGSTLHGTQFRASHRADTPTSYYTEASGAGLLLSSYRERNAVLRVGIVGLGAGTLAVYGRPGDEYIFYEINPLAIDLANRHFSFLQRSKAKVKIVPGDARLSLAAETETFEVLVVDAFTSDAIPVHLLTKEAIAIYLNRLAPNGVLAVHISNRHLDLEPVLKSVQEVFGLSALLVDADHSTWVVLAQNESALPAAVKAKGIALRGKASILWTDDFTTLLPVLRIRSLSPF